MEHGTALYIATQFLMFWFEFAFPLIGVRVIYMALYGTD